MKLDFQPIYGFGDVEEALAIVELKALFHGVVFEGDLEWDDDQLLTSFLDTLDDEEIRKDYREEPNVGVQIAKERFLIRLREIILERHKGLGSQSPFTWSFQDSIILERKCHRHATYSSLAYLWLAFFWIYSSGKDYLVVDDATPFTKEFHAVFEHICCIAIATRSDSVAIWYLGDSRNSSELLRRLNEMAALCGSGAAKAADRLEENQKAANDAGVDVVAVELYDEAVRRDSLAYLIGATVQQANRRNKIMGSAEINRFKSFFDPKPNIAYKGVLAVPFEARPAEEQDCRDEECLYISKDELLRYLGRDLNHKALRYLAVPLKKLKKASETLRGSAQLASSGKSLKLNWE